MLSSHFIYYYVECCYAECHYAEYCYAECHYAEYCYADCRSAPCHWPNHSGETRLSKQEEEKNDQQIVKLQVY